MTNSGYPASEWIGPLIGFVLGLLSTGITGLIGESLQRRRLVKAIRLEILRNRGVAVATAWEIAVADGSVHPEIARRTLEVIHSDPIRAATMDRASRETLGTLAADRAACEGFNRDRPRETRYIAPPPLAMVVYSAHSEVLGHVAAMTGSAVMNVYAAIPGINRIAEDMQSAGLRIAQLGGDPVSGHFFRQNLAENQSSLKSLYEVFIADCDRALARLPGVRRSA